MHGPLVGVAGHFELVSANQGTEARRTVRLAPCDEGGPWLAIARPRRHRRRALAKDHGVSAVKFGPKRLLAQGGAQ